MIEVIEKIYNYYMKNIFYQYRDKVRGLTKIKVIFRKLLSREFDKPEGENFLDKEWDNLIILDACRHDLYQELEGETSYIYSNAYETSKWVEETFSNRETGDIVVVTANPHYEASRFQDLVGKMPSEQFHSLWCTYQDKWDETENTVLPEDVVKDAETAEKLFPKKKKIIHFIQPHYPFIGQDMEEGGIGQKEGVSVWDRAERGEYNREEVWEGYRENLETVLPHAKDLAKNLSGKTVITADHGNLVGEKSMYGHDAEFDSKLLRKVPWESI